MSTVKRPSSNVFNNTKNLEKHASKRPKLTEGKKECINKEQLKDHLWSLTTSVDECETVDDKDNYDLCSLCHKSRLLLAKPKHCWSCGFQIPRNVKYFSNSTEQDSDMFFCTGCFNNSDGEIRVDDEEKAISKSDLVPMKNIDDSEEKWVQCDKCEKWSHQICSLYNEARDSDEKSKFQCPKCWVKQMENGDYKPTSEDKFFNAKNLPQTALSNHIEERLSRRLKQERRERANAKKKSFHEVPGVQDICVRVVLSKKKNLQVNADLLTVIHDLNYPSEFEYTSKMILLFQKLGGLDVCIFAMYVQEYGSECDQPNNRCAYISYLDSVKYFTPNISTANGEPLRSVVYHELLISYLDYIKKRGFAQCFLWSCPPEKGQEYVLYCRPESQKTPTSDRLRHWYHEMIEKAIAEGIVVGRSTFYDRFFVESESPTIARLPNFDGDFWPGAVMEHLVNIDKDLNKSVTKDVVLMKKLGETILLYKEDFMVFDLQYVCTNCHKSIVSGKRWYNKKLHLCESCHEKKSLISSKGDRLLAQAPVHIRSETVDEDGMLDIDICSSRESFVDFLQTNFLQFNTVRRAKHSTMMLLYKIFSIETSCRICQKKIAGTKWSCKICPIFNVCSACHQEKGSSCHDHKLSTPITSFELPVSEKVLLLKIMKHASKCDATKAKPCTSKGCKLVKAMFRHLKACNVHTYGGCIVCRRVWYSLQCHSRQCTDQICHVPHCKDLKEQKLRK